MSPVRSAIYNELAKETKVCAETPSEFHSGVVEGLHRALQQVLKVESSSTYNNT